MPERLSVARRILTVLADEGGLPGRTLGEIEVLADLHRGTASHQRITELRSYGWSIVMTKNADGLHRYHVLARERERMKRYLAILRERGVRTAKLRRAA